MYFYLAIYFSITDAMNDTKDKVKYLESLRRHFDQLYHDATPASIINNAIPGITNSVRQMDSISRYYARTGFLGLMFTKITNQLVLACKEYIKNCTITAYDTDELWERISEEIRERDTLPNVDPQQRLLRSQVEAKLKVRFMFLLTILLLCHPKQILAHIVFTSFIQPTLCSPFLWKSTSQIFMKLQCNFTETIFNHAHGWENIGFPVWVHCVQFQL